MKEGLDPVQMLTLYVDPVLDQMGRSSSTYVVARALRSSQTTAAVVHVHADAAPSLALAAALLHMYQRCESMSKNIIVLVSEGPDALDAWLAAYHGL